jgi:hypothetical protein
MFFAKMRLVVVHSEKILLGKTLTILMLPGNHLDSNVDERQVLSIIDLLDMMHQKGRHA